MLRRGVGVGAVKKREQTQSTFKQVGAQLEESSLQHLQSSLATFRASLETFAFQHKNAIASQPLFRAQFHSMCLAIGVDPLACQKSFWTDILGGSYTDFYYELGVQIMDICIAARSQNGGIMTVEDVIKILRTKYKHQQNITVDDIVQSVSKLNCLGSGFVLLPVGGPRNPSQHLIKSVPLEFNVDHVALLNFAATTPADGEKGCVKMSEVKRVLNWSEQRIRDCIHVLVEEGMLWMDGQGKETAYYFPSLAL